jgi:hypothetical protein
MNESSVVTGCDFAVGYLRTAKQTLISLSRCRLLETGLSFSVGEQRSRRGGRLG